MYKGGKDNGNSDALGRLPLHSYPSEVPVPGEVIQMLERLANTPLDAAQIKQWTKTDPVLSQVLLYTTKGWPNSCPIETLKPYFTRKDEISIQCGCLLWGNRVTPQTTASVAEWLRAWDTLTMFEATVCGRS